MDVDVDRVDVDLMEDQAEVHLEENVRQTSVVRAMERQSEDDLTMAEDTLIIQVHLVGNELWYDSKLPTSSLLFVNPDSHFDDLVGFIHLSIYVLI